MFNCGIMKVFKKVYSSRNFGFLFTKNLNLKYFSVRENPIYIERDLNYLENISKDIIKSNQDKRNNNILYQKYIQVNQKIKNDPTLFKNFDLETLINEQEINLEFESLNFQLENMLIENDEIINLVKEINQLSANAENFENKKECNSFKEKVNSLLTLLESEYSKTPDKINQLYEEYRNVKKYLKNLYDNNLIDCSLIQSTLNKYFSLLNGTNEIPFELVKENENFLFEVIENFYYKRNKLGELININEFNLNLKKTIENSIVTLTKYSGDKSTSLANFYILLGYYHLKSRNFDKAEDYSLRSLEIFNSSLENKKDVQYIQSYYILGEVYFNYHSDLKEAFLLLSEALNIIKKEENKILNERLQIFKFYTVSRIVSIYSLVEKENLKKELEVIEYYSNSADFNLLKRNYQGIFNQSVNILQRQAELYKNLEFHRQSYEVYKRIYNLKPNEEINSKTLDNLISLFKYSDDLNTNVNYLKKENPSKEIFDYSKDFVNYIMSLLIHSVKNRNFLIAKQFVEIIENNILRRANFNEFLSQNDLINFYTLSSITKKNLNELDSSNQDLTKILSTVYNLKEEKDSKTNLIKYHFNLGYNYILSNQRNQVIENFENCIKIIKSEQELSKERNFADLLTTIHFILANFYLSTNEINKAAIQLTQVNELINKLDKNETRAKLLSQYASEIQKELK